MNNKKNGLVIGKFYPPHLGHNYLISTAASQVDKLFVIVCGLKNETISAEVRAKWLHTMYPAAKIHVFYCDGVDENDSKLWAKITINILGFRPDVVFTSEFYGDPYAKYLGSEHVLVDQKRKTFNISGTKIRRDPFSSWELLTPLVKAHFAKRICIVGAESSGTTTLAKELAKYYSTSWVPEYGRVYYEGKMNSTTSSIWESNEFELIARQQNIIEDALAQTCNKILICDTDSFATSIWHERYMGFKSKKVISLSKGRKYDLYIVTNVDIPFVQDGTRDGEKIRIWMHKRFLEELTKYKKQYIVVSGSRQKRVQKSIEAISNLG